jgi:hypothetical protein
LFASYVNLTDSSLPVNLNVTITDWAGNSWSTPYPSVYDYDGVTFDYVATGFSVNVTNRSGVSIYQSYPYTTQSYVTLGDEGGDISGGCLDEEFVHLDSAGNDIILELYLYHNGVKQPVTLSKHETVACMSFLNNVTLQEGRNEFYLESLDVYGNTATGASYVIYKDTTAPTIKFISPSQVPPVEIVTDYDKTLEIGINDTNVGSGVQTNSQASASIVAEWRGTDVVSLNHWRYTNSLASTRETSIEYFNGIISTGVLLYNFSQIPDHYMTVSVTDVLGNSRTERLHFRFEKDRPLITSFYLRRYLGDVGIRVEYGDYLSSSDVSDSYKYVDIEFASPGLISLSGLTISRENGGSPTPVTHYVLTGNDPSSMVQIFLNNSLVEGNYTVSFGILSAYDSQTYTGYNMQFVVDYSRPASPNITSSTHQAGLATANIAPLFNLTENGSDYDIKG